MGRYPIRCFHCAHQDQQVEYQLSHIIPYNRNCRQVRVPDGGRACRKYGKDDAGQRNNCPFQTYPGVGSDEALPHGLGRLPGKRRNGDRRDRCIHVEFKHPPIHGQDHEKGQDGDQKAIPAVSRSIEGWIPASPRIQSIEREVLVILHVLERVVAERGIRMDQVEDIWCSPSIASRQTFVPAGYLFFNISNFSLLIVCIHSPFHIEGIAEPSFTIPPSSFSLLSQNAAPGRINKKQSFIRNELRNELCFL